jgi:hypothetical protein
MGTGIVSIGLRLDGVAVPSEAFMWLAIATLGATALAAASLARPGSLHSIRAAPAAPTLVAAPCVVGSRLALAGADLAAAAILGGAIVAALALLPMAAARRVRSGSGFLPAVAAFAVSASSSLLGRHASSAGVAGLGLALLALGAVLYVGALARFDPAELGEGRGDHWIAGGALAIATLASALAASAAARIAALSSLAPALRVLAWAAWALAISWLVVLVVAEVRRPRRWIDRRRWASVFPLGMYATATFVLARAESAKALETLASIWIWVAIGAWIAAAIASARLLRPQQRRRATAIAARGRSRSRSETRAR